MIRLRSLARISSEINLCYVNPGAKNVSNLRSYRHHIFDPKRGNTLPIFLQKIEEKISISYIFFSTPFPNLRPYRLAVHEPKRSEP